MIKLLIADDHQVLLDGFTAICNLIEDFTVVATAKDGLDVLSKVEKETLDVILMDINMPNLNGVETCKKLSKTHPEIKVVALSMYDQQSYLKRMLQYGAKGYLLKNDHAAEIEKGIREVAAGKIYISTQLKDKLGSISYLINNQPPNHSQISSRESEVLQFIADGFTDQQIAEKLFISIHTVNSHRKNLLVKFKAKNTAELVKKTIEQGLI